jgi:RES domain-containing protein
VKVRQVGNAWTIAGTSVVLQVPSAIMPDEHNFLLKPRHPDLAKLVIGKPSPFGVRSSFGALSLTSLYSIKPP